MFPFLIGKVLTVSTEPLRPVCIEFPFLIGKVLTEDNENEDTTKKELFPFLIGKVLTMTVSILCQMKAPECISFHSL